MSLTNSMAVKPQWCSGGGGGGGNAWEPFPQENFERYLFVIAIKLAMFQCYHICYNIPCNSNRVKLEHLIAMTQDILND